jgi:hypothetical protein
MTTQPTSHFNARSDQAALALKAGLRDRDGNPLQSRQVQVDAQGNPARPLPPEGSYARMQIERQQAAAAARQNPQIPEQVQPAASEAPMPQGQPQVPADPSVTETSPNAQRRFSELTALVRQKDQELQQALARSKQLEESNAQTQSRLQAIEQNYQNMVNQNLDALDPETRLQVLQEAKLQEAIGGMEARVMSRIAPVLDSFQQRAVQADLERLSRKYPGFAVEVHLPLIEMFREKNPHCSVEQAFRAVAEPEELFGNQQERAAAIPPPIAMPSQGNGIPRSVPQQVVDNTTPEKELEASRQRFMELARSSKPEDRRAAQHAADDFIRRKLGSRLPTGNTNYRR